MALGKRKDEQREMWVATTALPKSQGHVFYRKLNQVLAEAEFDQTVENLCRPYYHSHIGRAGIPPGVYFRMLLVGYFKGIGSQRGIDVEIEEAAADKGYHATDTEPKRRGERNWRDVPEEKRRAVINNRRRTRRLKSKRLQGLRSERVERSFAHACDSGGGRRSWLCGIEKVQKRYLIAAVARNLGLLMRKAFAIGTPKGLQAASGLVSSTCIAWFHVRIACRRLRWRPTPPLADLHAYATA
ncbi:MAG: hypothetical protein ABSA26_17080, partial [Thermoguttaceae bacterium]